MPKEWGYQLAKLRKAKELHFLVKMFPHKITKKMIMI